jgi:hypothetical protein
MYKRVFATVVSAVLVAGLAHAAEIPEVKEIGSPVFLDSFNGSRPDIACDALGQPHAVVEDLNKNNPAWRFYDQVGSQWQVTPFSLRSHYSNGDEFGNPHVEISDEGVAWYSGRMSSLRTALGWGMGMVVRTDMTSNPGANLYFFRDNHGIRTPLGDVSLDPFVANRASTMIQTGPFKTYQFNPTGGTFSDVGGGRLNLGNGGEKVAFRISHANTASANTWHGCTEQFYVNSKLGASLIWANWKSYPSMWDDGCYPGLGTDSENSDVAYMAADYKMAGYPPYGIYINIYNPEVSSGMAFGHDPLLVDPNGTSGLRRYPPRWAPAKDGGAWLCWTRYNNIMLRYIPADLKRDYAGQPYAESLAKCGPEITVGPGTRGAIATDPDGNIHLIYVNNGMQYRKIIVNAFAQGGFIPAQDFDGDGADDVAMFSQGKWYIRYSNDIKTMDGAALTPNYIKLFGTAGDIPVPGNYDGNPNNGAELAVYRSSSSRWYVKMASGTTETNFGEPGDIPVPGDYNGDGQTDMAIVREDNGTLKWFSADGSFTDFPFGVRGDHPICADYDGDGTTDLAIVRIAPDDITWQWIIHQSSGGTTNVSYGLVQSDIPVPHDYDGDGTDDVGVFRQGMWYYFGSSVGQKSVGWGASSGDMPVPGDYDGDGTTDLTTYRASNRSWYISSSGSSGALIEAAPPYLGDEDSIPFAADFDGDSIDDMCTFDPGTQAWSMWLSGATGGDRNEPSIARFGVPGDVAAPADYDGDSTEDVAVFRPGTGEWFMYGSSWGPMYVPGWGRDGDTPIPADYDGDGRADWAVSRPHSGNLWWLIYQTQQGYLTPFPFGWATDKAIPDDYDGDGTDDIAVFRPSDAQWFVVLSGGGGLANWFYGAPGDIPLHGQFDGDIVADFGVYRPSTGEWFLWSSEAKTQITGQWGVAYLDQPIPGKFDGDNTVDIAVFRPTTDAAWYIDSSKNPGVVLARGPIRWAWNRSDNPIGSAQ